MSFFYTSCKSGAETSITCGPSSFGMFISTVYISLCSDDLCLFPLVADVKTDDRAKMSVAAKMSLFKVSPH